MVKLQMQTCQVKSLSSNEFLTIPMSRSVVEETLLLMLGMDQREGFWPSRHQEWCQWKGSLTFLVKDIGEDWQLILIMTQMQGEGKVQLDTVPLAVVLLMATLVVVVVDQEEVEGVMAQLVKHLQEL
ncbi:MAG: hypothetical protein KJ077_39855 [Anaerolineae bacterium]|nr:hypothetical protein [Anaerolineae bacterium]